MEVKTLVILGCLMLFVVIHLKGGPKSILYVSYGLILDPLSI